MGEILLYISMQISSLKLQTSHFVPNITMGARYPFTILDRTLILRRCTYPGQRQERRPRYIHGLPYDGGAA